jgi:hypothetical protein
MVNGRYSSVVISYGKIKNEKLLLIRLIQLDIIGISVLSSWELRI